MKYPSWLFKTFYTLSDLYACIVPRKSPTQAQWRAAKVMAHRGVFDNVTIKENTMAAFERAAAANVWSLEMDIRWTKDFQPVVHHDANTKRLFGKNIVINKVTLAELQQAIPDIPSLKQVVERFGKKIMLLLELKVLVGNDLAPCRQNLQAVLQGLTPMQDFHLISLIPTTFDEMDSYPSGSYFPIGMVKMKKMSELALKKDYAGVFGHYVFTKNSIVQQQLSAGKQVGTGFVNSKNCLYRELNRGVTILSCDDAEKIQKLIQDHLH